jgi:hypothetical protein
MIANRHIGTVTMDDALLLVALGGCYTDPTMRAMSITRGEWL